MWSWMGGEIISCLKKELQSSEIMAAFEDYTEGDNLPVYSGT